MQRQILFGTGDSGRLKVDVAGEAVARLNGGVVHLPELLGVISALRHSGCEKERVDLRDLPECGSNICVVTTLASSTRRSTPSPTSPACHRQRTTFSGFVI